MIFLLLIGRSLGDSCKKVFNASPEKNAVAPNEIDLMGAPYVLLMTGLDYCPAALKQQKELKANAATINEQGCKARVVLRLGDHIILSNFSPTLALYSAEEFAKTTTWHQLKQAPTEGDPGLWKGTKVAKGRRAAMGFLEQKSKEDFFGQFSAL